MAKGQSFCVSNVVRNVYNQYIGVGNVARRTRRGYVGVDNVARMFYPKIESTFIGVHYYENATYTENIRKCVDDTIQLKYTVTEVDKNIESGAYYHRVYLYMNYEYVGDDITFEYTMSKSTSGVHCQVVCWDENNNDKSKRVELSATTEFKTVTHTIVSGTHRVMIGFWYNAPSSAEMIIRNVRIGGVRII